MNDERLNTGVESWLLTVTRYLDIVSWVILFIMMIMTMIDVTLRKLPYVNMSVIGNLELTELMMVIVIFCSLAQCQAEDGHIKVDLVLKRFGPRVQSIVDTLTQLICFGLFSFMTWSLYTYASEMKEYGEVTMDLGLVKYPFVYIACIGCGLLTLVLLFKTIVALREVFES